MRILFDLSSSICFVAAFVAIDFAPAVSAQAKWTTILADDPSNPTTRPVSRNAAAVASDGVNRMYVFGGRSDSGNPDGTFWCYDAVTQTWTELYGTAANPLPSPRRHTRMALDPLRQKLVLFGGNSGGNAHLNDVWEYDLATQLWNDVTPAVAGPAPRSKHVMVFDLINVQVVVFGGTDAFTGGNPVDSVLHGWNGTTWAVLDTGTGPSPRVDAMIASKGFAGGEILLFGGIQAPTETWRWFGSGAGGGTWSLVPTATIPGMTGVNGARMVYDVIRDRYVMHAGNSGSGTAAAGRLDGTWEFDGIDWLDRGPSGLLGRRAQAMEYVPGIGKTIMFGGNASPTTGYRLNDLTEYQTNTIAAVQSIDPGCSLGTLTPNLSILGAPWQGDTITVSMTGTTGATASAMNVGFALNPINLGLISLVGCTLQPDPMITIPIVADPFSLQIPNLPAVPLFVQGLTLQPSSGSQLVDLGMTETLDVTVGIR